MVVEEKYVGEQDIPALQAIGWEGKRSFPFVILLILSIYYSCKYINC